MKRTSLWFAILVGLALLSSLQLGAEPVAQQWVRSDADGFPYGAMIAVDSQHNVVVTGWRLGS